MLQSSQLEEGCAEVSIAPEVQSSRPNLIHARTASWVSTQPARRTWEEKYAKRMACLEGGALSGIGVPFKITGGEISETRKLLTAILATHPESCPAELLEEYNETTSEQEINRSRKTTDKYSKSVLTLGDPDRFKEAGYDAIKDLLQETTEVMVACRRGEPYLEELDKIKKRKQAAIEAKAKVDVQFPIVRALSNETLRKIYRKHEKRSSKDDDGEEEEEEEEEEEIVLEAPECSPFRMQLPDINLVTPSGRDLTAAAPDSQASGLDPSHSNISLGSDASSAVASQHRVLSPGDTRLRVGGNSPSFARINPRRVEVWEDLLAVETTGETLGKSAPTKYRPPWQQTLTRDSLQIHLHRHKRDGKKDIRSKMDVLKTDPTLLVPNFREFLAQTREKVRRKTLQELEKLESCRLQKFRLVFQSMNSVGEIPEKFFPRMRKLLEKTETEYTTDWYRRLTNEAESLQMETKDSVVPDLLKKLKQFVYNQPTDQPLYREKMCLLVLSLPADEICRPAWQTALIFVMVRVFEWRLDVLKYWLSTRHLYILPYIEDNN